MRYCTNCGKPFEETLNFCPQCGAATKQEKAPAPQPPIVAVGNRKSGKIRKILYIVIGILAVVLCGISVLLFCSINEATSKENTTIEQEKTGEAETVLSWQEQYDLGMKYLLDGNYEEAIIAFEVAIELEPKEVEAYLGLADVYIALEDYDYAIEILTQRAKDLSDESIQIKLDEIQEKLAEETPAEPTTILIDSPYFTVELPKSWEEHYGVTLRNTQISQDGTYSLDFDCGSDSGYMGNSALVFTLWLWRNTEDYQHLPNYDEVGTIYDQDGTPYYMIAYYPSDVQFNEDYREIWTEMTNDVPQILQTITPTEGYTWVNEIVPAPAEEGLTANPLYWSLFGQTKGALDAAYGQGEYLDYYNGGRVYLYQVDNLGSVMLIFQVSDAASDVPSANDIAVFSIYPDTDYLITPSGADVYTLSDLEPILGSVTIDDDPTDNLDYDIRYPGYATFQLEQGYITCYLSTVDGMNSTVAYFEFIRCAGFY